MDADLHPIYLLAMQAEQPEDLFGAEDVVLPANMLLQHLDLRYRAFKAVTSPSAYHLPLDVEAARDADAKLELLFEEAKQRIRDGLYGMRGYGVPIPKGVSKNFTVRANTYFIGPKVASCSRVETYQGYLVRDGKCCGEVIIELASSPENNASVQNEVRILSELRKQEVPQWKHLPFLMDRFRAGERVGLTYRKYVGHSLEAVRKHRIHRSGIDQKHMVWMLDRILSCLGYVHSQGVIHGVLNPKTVLIQAETHNAIVTNWHAAAFQPALSGARVVTEPSAFTPPEIDRRSKIGPWSDIYSLGKLMIWVLGGDPQTNSIPGNVEEPLRGELLRMVHETPSKRPSDAWKLHEVFTGIKDDLWPRKFLHFDLA